MSRDFLLLKNCLLHPKYTALSCTQMTRLRKIHLAFYFTNMSVVNASFYTNSFICITMIKINFLRFLLICDRKTGIKCVRHLMQYSKPHHNSSFLKNFSFYTCFYCYNFMYISILYFNFII